jgi:hypothetical protein
MAETYSQSVTGILAQTPFSISNIKIGDSACQTLGSVQQTMRNGTQVLCQFPDGSKRWCTIDASRSRPGGPLFLLPVGP